MWPFSSQPTTKLFIDGKFIESKTSEWIDIHNPVSNSISCLKNPLIFSCKVKKSCFPEDHKKNGNLI